MKHTRIRTFNTKDTYPEQKLDNDLCQAVVARGRTVFLRGQIGQDLDTSESVCIGDVGGQAEQAMTNIEMLLKEAGGELQDICKITIYLIDPRYREAVYRVVGRRLKGVFPVSTGIVVSALARPEWLVEIDATAVIPDKATGLNTMTFSIIARCPRTGRFGAAVSSSSPAVASRCIRARAGVGAAVSQNITDPTLGVMALDLMAQGITPQQALERLREQPHIDYRQLMAIDASNPPAAFTGSSALGTLASEVGEHAACAGNMLASIDVPKAMLRAFEAAEGSLAERLMRAMLAGQAAGGEEGPVHSAGLLVVGELSWPSVDLRLDWVEDGPVEALYEVWKLYEPQEQAYITRAKDPRSAPSYGVPGDR